MIICAQNFSDLDHGLYYRNDKLNWNRGLLISLNSLIIVVQILCLETVVESLNSEESHVAVTCGGARSPDLLQCNRGGVTGQEGSC